MECRTIAVVAHVDHGKTTLLDRLLRQAGANGAALDALPLERERGITIAAKFAAVTWRNQRLQFVDTPGHGDFGGEVER
jgi:GTP-binding protein